MKTFIQLSLEEYEELKNKAEQQKIPADVLIIRADKLVYAAEININMRELKLQICRQNSLNPEEVTVNFY